MNSRTLAWPQHDEAEAARLGMWIFLGSELLFFGGLALAYAWARAHWSAGFAEAGRHTHVVLGTLNTALLLTSSAVVALAVACTRHPPQARWTARLLWLTAALGLAFLAVKAFEYGMEWREHLVPGAGFALRTAGSELFFLLYFLLTGIHAVHLLAGVVLMGVLARGATPRGVEAGALYWHFVDLVWIFLYPLIYLLGRNT
ncbi:cytochrome c oxidase subunit 3 [Ramlibacter alkalitolerans]|uniref:Cytochrome c oxidase subunit 3 n=1 Tax=Ramlibacter alkalitolerans TaxID=2039631 RepID=A0ABS1JIC9_9BURK|nr:cytochrome c oxidase subunit 3 [Ramlibacter alkalitolerans]MBL0423978.1 cytochrome c oxidase subunit 3 [Ramlibacter alkalitolerans]